MEGMESVYFSGRVHQRYKPKFCSEKISFKDYFSMYTETVHGLFNKPKPSITELFYEVLGLSADEDLSKDEIIILQNAMDPKNFKTSYLRGQPAKNESQPSTSKDGLSCATMNNTSLRVGKSNTGTDLKKRPRGRPRKSRKRRIEKEKSQLQEDANTSLEKDAVEIVSQFTVANKKCKMSFGESPRACLNVDKVSAPSESQEGILSEAVVSDNGEIILSPKKSNTTEVKKKKGRPRGRKTSEKNKAQLEESANSSKVVSQSQESPLIDATKYPLRRSCRNKSIENEKIADNAKTNRSESLKSKISEKVDLISEDNSDVTCPSEVYERPTLKSVKEMMDRIKRRSTKKPFAQTVKGQIVVDTTNKIGPKDLKPRMNFVVSFRIHKPFNHALGEKGYRPGKCLQEINVLNYQTLSDLRRKIVCEADYQDVSGDVSAWPYLLGPQSLSKDTYKSGMFYIGNTFYVDTEEGSKDYSVELREWGAQNGLNLGETMPMDQTRIEDLEARFGYPYVYKHQGSCEHLIIISDARLLSPNDSLHSSDYPNISKTTRSRMIYCVTCLKKAAEWIVVGSDRMLHNVSYMCGTCFYSYHYIDTKKIGTFKAYRWKQRAVIYH